MNVWLCPVKPGSWRVIMSSKVFGTSRHASNIIKKVKPYDLLIIHVLRPVNGIVAICRAISEVYEDNSDIWGKDRYPLRVQIEIVTKIGKNKPAIPISSMFGYSSNLRVTVEPYLKSIWLIKISEQQYNRLRMILKEEVLSL